MKYADVPILMYHDIGLATSEWCVSEENFTQQMMLLKQRGYRTMSLSELKEGVEEEIEGRGRALVGNAVVITFDDARRGVYSVAYPLLQRLGFKATIYIVPKWIEGEGVPREELYSGFLNWNQLRDLALAGWEMGSHSLKHQDLRVLSEEQLVTDLMEAQGIIHRQTMQHARHFCYPYGKYTESVLQIVQKRYSTGVSVHKGFAKKRGEFARQWVLRNTTLSLFERLLSRPRISLCMIVKNEEQFLGDCLKSVAGLVDEMIVVDTGSVDGTKEIALNAGARVFDFGWCNDFSSARNEALKYVTGDWILVLDADEVLVREDHGVILEAVNEWGVSGYRVLTKNYSNQSGVSNWVACAANEVYAQGFSGWHPSLKVRLFQKREGVIFEGAVHEMVDGSITGLKGRIEELPVVVHHYGALRGSEDMRGSRGTSEREREDSGDSKDRENREEKKREMYIALAQKKIENDPEDGKAYFELGVQYKERGEFGKAEEMLRRAVSLVGEETVIPLLNLGIVLHKQQKWREAENVYAEVVERGSGASGCAEAYFGLGFCALRQGRLNDARDDFEKAVAAKEGYLDALINLGSVYERLELYPQAIKVLARAITLHPRNGMAYYNLGVVYENVFAIPKAIMCYKKAIELRYVRLEELREKVVKMETFLREEEKHRKEEKSLDEGKRSLSPKED